MPTQGEHGNACSHGPISCAPTKRKGVVSISDEIWPTVLLSRCAVYELPLTGWLERMLAESNGVNVDENEFWIAKPASCSIIKVKL